MAFADVSDIESRWRTLTSDEEAKAGVLLEDASAMLTTLVPRIDVANEVQLRNLNAVCCNMVIRAMSASESESYGVDSMSMTAGPYAQTWNYSNTSGDMYLTKMEKRLLGITSGYVTSIRPRIGGCDD